MARDQDVWSREDDHDTVRPTRITNVPHAQIMAYYPTSTRRGICLASWTGDFVTWQLSYGYSGTHRDPEDPDIVLGEWIAEAGHYFNGSHQEEAAWNDFWERKERGY